MKGLATEQIENIEAYNKAVDGLYSPYATTNDRAERLYESTRPADPLRSPFSVDVDRIIYCKFFNRGAEYALRDMNNPIGII